MLNILVIVGILLLAYWNYFQGFFTAFIHLVLVVCCGAMAFALWEPVAVGMLMGMMPKYAWAAGLVIPFVLLLLIGRFVIDHYVPENVNFGQLVNMLGGGLCGAASAVLSSGILVIALWHMPFPPEAFGAKPYMVNPATGQITEDTQSGGSLLVPVDRIAVGFFGALSDGSFAGGMPLRTGKPDMIRLAHEMRIRPINGSISATPATLSVTGHVVQNTPVLKLAQPFNSAFRGAKGGNPLSSDKHKVVMVDTQWTLGGKTFDDDSKLRVPPTQIRLVTMKAGESKPVLHLPVAFSNITDATTSERKFTLINSDEIAANSIEGEQTTTIGWVFIIPNNHTEQFFIARHLRFALTDGDKKAAEDHANELAAAIGVDVMETDKKDDGKTGSSKTQITGVKVEITPELPTRTSKNLARGLNFGKSNGIVDGKSVTAPPQGRISPATLVKQLEEKPGEAIVRVALGREKAKSIHGRAIQLAAELNSIYLRDNQDQDKFPIGYVVSKSTRGMEINIDRLQPIRSISQLPVSGNDLAPGEAIYLYFTVKRGVRLMSLRIGTEVIEDLKSMTVPK